MAVGASGVLFTIGLYSYLFSQLNHPTGMFAESQKMLLAKQTLPGLIKEVEFHKQTHGSYPRTLDELDNKLTYSKDMPFQRDIHYSLSADGTHYYLLSAGPDKLPFTADDIHPELSAEALSKTGYLKKGP